MQTILQMYKENNKEYKVGEMRDYPRFQTRGFCYLMWLENRFLWK